MRGRPIMRYRMAGGLIDSLIAFLVLVLLLGTSLGLSVLVRRLLAW